MAVLAQDIIDKAFDDCNVKASDESMSATDYTDARVRLNNFIKLLNNQNLVSAFTAREVFPLTADKGTYTIGVGGDFDTTRPFTIEAAAILQNPTITSAIAISSISTSARTFTVAGDQTSIFTSGTSFVVTGGTQANEGSYTTVTSAFGVATVITVAEVIASSTVGGATITAFTSDASTVEIPRTIYTEQAWQQIQVKALTNSLPTGIYFEASYASDLALIQLWPIPDISTNALVLYRRNMLAQFADLATTSYAVPPGFEEVLEYGLAMRLGTPYALSNPEVKADIKERYREAISIVKRTNQANQLTDVELDPAWTKSHGAYYNIETGNY